MEIFITTVLHRPYVFAFLVSFLVIGFLNRGVGRTLLFLVLGFSIAFLSEVSSIRNGFPYGMYVYVYENMKGEAMLWGVPLWDSLSYSFLAYAAYEYAAYFSRGPVVAAFLMMFLDVATDPLAVRGDRWFLGHIFYYPNGGEYFGVPLTNFGGWLLVATVIFFSYSFLEKSCFQTPAPLRAHWLGPLFYGSILAFNLLITFWIGDFILGTVGTGIHLLISTILFKTRRRYPLQPSRHSRSEPGQTSRKP